MRSRRLLVTLIPLLAGCRHASHPFAAAVRPPETVVAAGVVHRSYPEGDPLSPSSEVNVLDVDLQSGSAQVTIVSGDSSISRSRVYADSHTVLEWCRGLGALGGVNGGFFGTTEGSKKEVIGLLATTGEIVASGRIIRSTTNPDRQFVRCVFSVSPEGTPHIGWAVGQRGRGALLTEYAAPLDPTSQTFWKAQSAVACGPRLVRAGKVNITDRDERLVSPPAVHRTFVGYDLEKGHPRHLVLGVADRMTFAEVAAFLQRYFREVHFGPCAEAMCLDGGSSTQLVYRVPTGYESAIPSSVTVPTAIMVVPRKP